MLRRAYVILILLEIALQSRAQQLPSILTASQYKKGVYKSFAEFLRNEPSITQNFEIQLKSGDRKVEKGTAIYKLVFLDSAYTRRDKKKLWGACDGENIYVNEFPAGSNFVFRKILSLGRYCTFMGSVTSTAVMPAMVGGVPGALPMSYTEMVPFVININTGRFFELNKMSITKVLQQDTALLNDYENDTRPRSDEKLLLYARLYSEKHIDEAYLDRIVYSDILFYRRSKKEIVKPVTVSVDTSLLVMHPETIYSFKTNEDSLQFCIDTKCTMIAVTRKRKNFVRCEWKDDATVPLIEKVEPKEGDFQAKEVQFRMEKRLAAKTND